MAYQPTDPADFAQLVELRADPNQRRTYERLRNAIATANHGLVVRIAQRYGGSDDQQQAGAIGLLQALERFDPSQGKLASFAAIYIERAIRDELDARRLMRVPEAIGDDLRRLERDPDAFDPTEREQLRQLSARTVASLDARHPETGTTLHDRLADSQTPADDALDAKRLDDVLAECVASLEPARRRLVAWRFGLPDVQPTPQKQPARQRLTVDAATRERLFGAALGRIGAMPPSELRALRPVLLREQWRCLRAARDLARFHIAARPVCAA